MWPCNTKKNDDAVPGEIARHPAWMRLEDQIGWYSGTSTRYQRWYKGLKFVQVSLAILIPLFSQLPPEGARWATAVSGAMIALLEAVQHMNQYSTLWVLYRSTAEFLKHEKYLFLSAAGPYKLLNGDERLILLAERVEERVSVEH